ncbi:MAG: hypothetical protein EOO69_11320 [Moraxellaceae bacterium]|nr:MAG: hypothetical protein EOO69_11320 [Moraxellaceae bacterium]
MKVGKNLLPWLLIASSVMIASITCHHQASLDAAKKGDKTDQHDEQQAVAKSDKAQSARVSNASEAPISVTYQCDDQKSVQAIYSAINVKPSTVSLIINGQQYQLYRVSSQIGKLYATEQGINAGQGMRWHMQGLEARLIGMTLDHTATPDKEQLLMRCQQPV